MLNDSSDSSHGNQNTTMLRTMSLDSYNSTVQDTVHLDGNVGINALISPRVPKAGRQFGQGFEILPSVLEDTPGGMSSDDINDSNADFVHEDSMTVDHTVGSLNQGFESIDMRSEGYDKKEMISDNEMTSELSYHNTASVRGGAGNDSGTKAVAEACIPLFEHFLVVGVPAEVS